MSRLVLPALLSLALLSACSQVDRSPSGSAGVKPAPAPVIGSRPDKDGAPEFRPGIDAIPDAVPRFEPVTAAGNKSPYTVLGATYRIEPKPYGYRQRGIASWYGTKFHGEFTSNGEPYDVYAMSAAHKTLPIPCYVRVRNLDNGRSVIVRINDRGPFHDGRIIDLSYAAAWKLGYANIGTANVEIELLDPGAPEWSGTVAKGPVDFAEQPLVQMPQMWVQAGAFRNLDGARQLQQRVALATGMEPVITQSGQGDSLLHRVRIGPIADPQIAFEAQRKIADADLGRASIVSE